MKGWIYKELRQSWGFLISALIFGMYPLLIYLKGVKYCR